MSAPTTPRDPAERVDAMIDAMLGTMILARELVLAHRTIDIAGLDQQAGLLCARVLDLPFEDWPRFRPPLHRLAEAAEALHTALADQKPPF
jgi:hypothetical protein